MDYQSWVDLFGRAADDALVRKAVTTAGITKPLKIGRDELTVIADVPGAGMSVIFTDDSILRPGEGLLGRPILSAVTIAVKQYQGPLPSGLRQDMPKARVREKLGDPKHAEERMRWDSWLIDGRELQVGYTKDLQAIRSVAVRMPGSR